MTKNKYAVIHILETEIQLPFGGLPQCRPYYFSVLTPSQSGVEHITWAYTNLQMGNIQ
jgi:hypothetical protein